MTHLVDRELIGNSLHLDQLLGELCLRRVQAEFFLLQVKSSQLLAKLFGRSLRILPPLAPFSTSPAELIRSVLEIGVCPKLARDLKVVNTDRWRRDSG